MKQPSPAARHAPHSRGSRWGWPVGIVIALALSAGANIAFMMVARSDQAFAIEPDYYEKSVRWDEAMAQERHNVELGWGAVAALTLARADAPGEIAITLRDREGTAVGGAHVSIVAMHNARASQRHQVDLSEREPGLYRAALDARRPGEWEIRVTADRPPYHFTQALRLSVGVR